MLQRPLMTNRDDSRSLTVKIRSVECNNFPFRSRADIKEVSQKDYGESARTIQAWQDCRSTRTRLSCRKILLSIPPRKQELAPFIESAPASHLPVRATGSPYAKSIGELLGQLDRGKIAPQTILSGSESCGNPSTLGGGIMLYWALMFLLVAIVAAVLGFTGIAVAAASIAKLLFFIFLLLFVITFATHLTRGRHSGI